MSPSDSVALLRENLEARVTRETPFPFDLHPPREHSVPLVISSPHSGREYPASFLAASRLDLSSLRRSEDSFIDRLFAHAPDIGGYLLAARFPRAYVDVNREPYELDPEMFDAPLPYYVDSTSRRAAGGLGTIARIVAENMQIYAGRLSFDEVKRRILSLYLPFHDALRKLMDANLERFGCAVLLDCHSMPSGASPLDSGGNRADVVLGDRHGASADAGILEVAYSRLCDMGYRVACNHPFAGGAITRKYGRPPGGMHALQIEINRALYMEEGSFRPLDGFHQLRQDMDCLMNSLGAFSLHGISHLSGFRDSSVCVSPTWG